MPRKKPKTKPVSSGKAGKRGTVRRDLTLKGRDLDKVVGGGGFRPGKELRDTL